MRNVKVHVGKGKTVYRKTAGKLVGEFNEEWYKVSYEIEAILNQKKETLEETRQKLEETIDRWLQKPLGQEEFPSPLTAAVWAAELDRLPWLTYGKKADQKPAEPGHSGWIKNPLKWENSDDPVAIRLARALEEEGGKIEIGDYSYQLSGREKQFIGRKPKKKEEATPPEPKTPQPEKKDKETEKPSNTDRKNEEHTNPDKKAGTLPKRWSPAK